MVGHEGGRWDVAKKNDAVYLERRSEDDERIFEALLQPEEARELAGLLLKMADKANSNDKTQSDYDESDDDEKSDSDDESDDDDDDDDEKSDSEDESDDDDDDKDSSD